MDIHKQVESMSAEEFRKFISENPPEVISKNKFNEKGFAVHDSEHTIYLPRFTEHSEGYLLTNKDYVPAYITSCLGFEFPGMFFLDVYLYPNLMAEGILPLCPFKACSEYLDFAKLSNLSGKELKQYVNSLADKVAVINREILMPKSKFIFNVLEGIVMDPGSVFDATSFSSMFPEKPAVSVRSNTHLSEASGAVYNLALKPAIDSPEQNRIFFDGFGEPAYLDAVKKAGEVADRIRKESA